MVWAAVNKIQDFPTRANSELYAAYLLNTFTYFHQKKV